MFVGKEEEGEIEGLGRGEDGFCGDSSASVEGSRTGGGSKR